MDERQYSRVMDIIAGLPDLGKARGKQLEWSFVSAIIVGAMLSQRRIPTIAQ